MKTYRSALALALPVLTAITAPATDLPPSGTNTISGVVRFTNADADILARLGPPGNEGMEFLSVFANSAPPDPLQASKTFSGVDKLSNPYALTVAADNVPRAYDVYATLTLDGGREEYWTPTYSSSPLTSNSPPATLDFDECAALLELRYVDTAGLPVAALGGRALVTETATGLWRARYLEQPPGRTGNFLVVPSGVEIRIAIEVDTGTDIYLDRLTHAETQTMMLACDEKPVITITIPDAVTLGRIVGNVNMTGLIEPLTDGYAELLHRPVIKARGPSGNQRYGAVDGEMPGVDLTRAFALENLVPSTEWSVQAEMQFGTGYRFQYFQTPALGYGLNPGVEVTAGAATDLANQFVMNPAKLTGSITLTGPLEIAGSLSALRGVVRSADYDPDMDGIPDGIGAGGIGGSYVTVSGVDELAPGATLSTAGASASASFAGAFNPATSAFEGDYEVSLGSLNGQDGVWKQDYFTLQLYHPGTNGGPYVDEAVYISEDPPWQSVLAPGGMATHDLSYGFAEVCYRIKSPAPFYNPRITSSYGYHTNYDGAGNVLSSYRAIVASAYGLPGSAADATHEALLTLYVPAGTYTLSPAVTILDPDGGVSYTQLPAVEVSLIAGERRCVEQCVNVVITPPVCSPTFGFIAFADASSCEATLTNLSLTARPLVDASIRLGYSDIRILEPVGMARTTLRTGHGLFPDFDGYADHPEYYRDIVYTAVANDNKGRVATAQIVAHYDFTAPVLNCSDITVTSVNGIDATVDYNITISGDDVLVCTPPSGNTFPVGATPVTCVARDLCRNTNACSFNVTVRGPNEDCVLRISLTQISPPEVTLTWDCAATLQSADTLDGPWTSIAGATSPYPTPAGGPMKFFRLCLSGDCSGDLVSNCTPAGLLAHEPFDYATGSALDPLNGGTGFSGAWSSTINGANYAIAAGSLAFAPLCASGGRMHSTVGHTQMSRQLSASFGSDGTTRFFSFLLRPEGVLNGGDLGGFHGLQLQGDAGALFIGKPGGAGGGVLAPYVLEEVGGAGQVISTVAPVIDETVLLVVKAEFAAGNDTFTLHVNPPPGSPEPVTGAVKSDLNLGTSNSLLIYSGGEFSLDEIRVGETFESVTPRP